MQMYCTLTFLLGALSGTYSCYIFFISVMYALWPDRANAAKLHSAGALQHMPGPFC